MDANPQWACLLVAELPLAGAEILQRRERALTRLGELLGRGSPRASAGAGLALRPGLTGELVVGGVFSVIRGRVVRHQGVPLTDLAPSLMSLIVLPYLGEEAARAELARKPLGHAAVTAPQNAQLPTRATYRTALVLRAIERAPRCSNRDVASSAGLADEGQTSKLLSRLQRRGLIENVGLGQAYGEPNAWLLTVEGRRVAQVGSRASGLPAQTSRPPRPNARATLRAGRGGRHARAELLSGDSMRGGAWRCRSSSLFDPGRAWRAGR